MKIGLVRRQFGAGGAEAALSRFGGALLAAGHTCTLYTAATPDQRLWSSDPSTVRLVPAGRPIQFATMLRQAAPERECDLLFSFERVWSCDCYRAGDGVHAAWLERRARNESSWRTFLRGLQGRNREILRLERALFRPDAVRAVIANSSMVKAEIIRHFDYPAERIHVVYNGAPLAPARDRAAARQALGIEPGKLVLLFVGGGWERKGLRHAIRAVNGLADSSALLVVAGKGSPRRFPSSSRVRYLGPVPEMGDWLAAADLFVLPTIYDPFSNACLEAAGAGLPVITSAANGFSEIITAGVEGEILPEPADTDALQRAIEKWADPEKRAAAAPAIRALAARFSVEKNFAETLQVLTPLLGKRETSPLLDTTAESGQ